MLKKIVLCLTFLITTAISCEKKEENILKKTECEQIKDIVTDCMGLRRGAFNYIKSCGDAKLSIIKEITLCQDIFDYIESN